MLKEKEMSKKMNKKMNKIVIILLCIIIGLLINVSFSSAKLDINQTILSITKTINIDEFVVFSITNTEAFAFYNVTIEGNAFMTMPKIDQLNSGSVAVVTATVTSNVAANSQLRIRGLFNTSIGHIPTIYYVNITTSHTVNPCDKSIIKGDTITWNNLINDNIQMILNGAVETTFAPSGTYGKTFTSPGTYNYYFSQYGFQFPSYNCHIYVLDDNGYVNDPMLDAVFNLSVAVNYPPTALMSNILQTNYIMDFFNTQDGVMSVTNTGNQTAQNIQLSGDWFSFSDNGFTLNPGQTKGVIYTIIPIIINTTQTNNTYLKNISISGNFPTVKNELSIFINYAAIGTNDSYNDAENLLDIICAKYPPLCNKTAQIVYRYVGNTSAQAQLNISEEQWNNLWFLMFDEMDARKTMYNYIKEQDSANGINTNLTNDRIANITGTIMKQQENQESATIGVYVLLIMLFSAFIGGITYFLIKYHKKQGLETELHKW